MRENEREPQTSGRPRSASDTIKYLRDLAGTDSGYMMRPQRTRFLLALEKLFGVKPEIWRDFLEAAFDQPLKKSQYPYDLHPFSKVTAGQGGAIIKWARVRNQPGGRDRVADPDSVLEGRAVVTEARIRNVDTQFKRTLGLARRIQELDR